MPSLKEAIYVLIEVFEAGALNSAQALALIRLRNLMGEANELCPHENTAYEEGDELICQDCRKKLK